MFHTKEVVYDDSGDERKETRKRLYLCADLGVIGVSLGTVQKIFCGETLSPRYDTLRALEDLFIDRPLFKETSAYQMHTQGSYTLEDYYNLPDDQRVELIDGYFYNMSSPTFNHQLISGEVHRQIANFIMDKGGDCIPFIAPLDVQLDCDEKTMVQPDVAILCQRDKKRRRCVYGAPDFVLEVISPFTSRKDYTKKLQKYMDAGVREYWILDPYQRTLLVYYFEGETCPIIYGLDQPVSVNIYHGELLIDFTHIVDWIENEAGDMDE